MDHGLTRAASPEGDIDLRVTQESHPGGWGREAGSGPLGILALGTQGHKR